MTTTRTKTKTKAALLKIAKATFRETGLLVDVARAVRNANGAHHHIERWYGARGGSNQRTYRDYIAMELPIINAEIDSESARYPMTKHAEKAIDEQAAFWTKRLSK